MRGIMGVPEVNAWNHLLHHLQKILFRSLPDLPRRQCSSRVGDEESAELLLNLRLPDHRFNLIRQIHDLFACGGTDARDLSHMRSALSTTSLFTQLDKRPAVHG